MPDYLFRFDAASAGTAVLTLALPDHREALYRSFTLLKTTAVMSITVSCEDSDIFTRARLGASTKSLVTWHAPRPDAGSAGLDGPDPHAAGYLPMGQACGRGSAPGSPEL